MPTFDKRLKELEAIERRAEHERHTAWLQSLSDDELDAHIDALRCDNPEGWAQVQAMTDAELEAAIEQAYA